MIYGGAVHASEQTCGSPSPFCWEDVLLVLTFGRFVLVLSMSTSRAQERGRELLFEDGNMEAGMAGKKWVLKDNHIHFLFVFIGLCYGSSQTKHPPSDQSN